MISAKEFLNLTGLNNVQDLIEARGLFTDLARQAQTLGAGQFFSKFVEGLKTLPQTIELTFTESAGESNDNRNEITLGIALATEEEADKILQLFKIGKLEELLETGELWEDKNNLRHQGTVYHYSPGDDGSEYREIMDEINVLYGDYNDTSVTLAEFLKEIANANVPPQSLGLIPTECARCGSELDQVGFCKDTTCPFDSVLQSNPQGWIGHPNPPSWAQKTNAHAC